jgi:hypothetical protein
VKPAVSRSIAPPDPQALANDVKLGDAAEVTTPYAFSIF